LARLANAADEDDAALAEQGLAHWAESIDTTDQRSTLRFGRIDPK
jgi:hypothetical protein